MKELNNLLNHKDLMQILKYAIKLLDSIWHYQIITIGKDSISTSNIIIASIIFILLIRFKKYASCIVKIRLEHVNQLDKNLKSNLHKLFDYILLALVVLFTLKISNLPVSAFSFIGGALAIGLGLGSQNIINNFISGLIIMFEQPIRIGDIVTIDKHTGKVILIGARCTHLLTDEQMIILIPNSILLQAEINNWTYSDNFIRTKIIFKIADNNRFIEVKEILYQIVSETIGVITDKKIGIYIIEMNKDIIVYEAIFYINIGDNLYEKDIIDIINTNVLKYLQDKKIKVA